MDKNMDKKSELKKELSPIDAINIYNKLVEFLAKLDFEQTVIPIKIKEELELFSSKDESQKDKLFSLFKEKHSLELRLFILNKFKNTLLKEFDSIKMTSEEMLSKYEIFTEREFDINKQFALQLEHLVPTLMKQSYLLDAGFTPEEITSILTKEEEAKIEIEKLFAQKKHRTFDGLFKRVEKESNTENAGTESADSLQKTGSIYANSVKEAIYKIKELFSKVKEPQPSDQESSEGEDLGEITEDDSLQESDLSTDICSNIESMSIPGTYFSVDTKDMLKDLDFLEAMGKNTKTDLPAQQQKSLNQMMTNQGGFKKINKEIEDDFSSVLFGENEIKNIKNMNANDLFYLYLNELKKILHQGNLDKIYKSRELMEISYNLILCFIKKHNDLEAIKSIPDNANKFWIFIKSELGLYLNVLKFPSVDNINTMYNIIINNKESIVEKLEKCINFNHNVTEKTTEVQPTNKDISSSLQNLFNNQSSPSQNEVVSQPGEVTTAGQPPLSIKEAKEIIAKYSEIINQSKPNPETNKSLIDLIEVLNKSL
jgi:ribosomal protein S17E